MKKRILFTIALSVLLISLFAVSVTAAEHFGDVEIIDLDGDGNSDIDMSARMPAVVTGDENTPSTSSARLKISCACEAGEHTFPAYYVTSPKSTGTRFYCFSYAELNALMPQYCSGAATVTEGETLKGTVNGTNILSYELPNGYKAIYSGFFYESINGSTKMAATNLEYFSFATCSTMTSLEGTSGGRNWFQGSSIVEADLGKYVTNIPVMLFYDCQSLTSVDIPNESAITTIDTSAFYNCKSLEALHIPKTVTIIGSGAFQKCSKVEFDTDFSHVTEFYSRAFSDSNLKSINLNNATKLSGDAIFERNLNLTTVLLGDNKTLTSLPFYGFGGCSSLTEITIPDQITSLPSSLFESCTSLKHVYIGENSQINSIGSRTFGKCESLEALYLPSGITALGVGGSNASPFDGCKSLYFINSPTETTKPEVYYFNNVATFTGEVFKWCANLNDVLVFNSSVTSIDNGWAFCNARAVTLVFLGNVENLSTTGNAWTSGMAIYFCNENDLSTADFTTKTNQKFVFCNAEGNTEHLYKVEANTLPTCLENGVNGFKCFCGKASDTATVVPALGHEKNELLSKYFASVNGTLDYYNDMITEHSCTRCQDTVIDTEDGTALFTKKGYSYSQYDSSTFSYTVYVNYDAIKAYNSELLYGIVVSASVDGTPISYDNGTLSHGDKTIAVEFQNTDTRYSIITAKLTNVADGTNLHLGAYCVDSGVVSYLGNDAVSNVCEIISHEILLEKYPNGKDE